MKIPTKRLANGFELPVYGLGLWQMGGRLEADYAQDGRDVAAIQAAIEQGVTHIDTAEMYGHGHAEELLARAVEGIDRAKLTIASKVSAEHQSYEGIKRALAASLERLKMDYVDLYMLHRFPLPALPIEDAMRAMDELVDEGLVRHIGVSNCSPARFTAAQAASKHKLVCNQVHYNVQYREVESRGVLKQCQNNDVMLVAWRPLQKGGLAETPLLVELGKKYGKTPAQVAINWLVVQDHVVTLSKTSTAAHLEENLGALGWALEAADVERIRREYPDQRLVSDAVPMDYAGSLPA
ncbi:MAG TPA: aldo/keto reductase [Candidatus Saccharimonadia bacterium]|jgi:diketogulonate reductase-like aldo/keto reductase|nr:aldo/keto reductase [Candidatus Saccharimonadia bacterium]